MVRSVVPLVFTSLLAAGCVGDLWLDAPGSSRPEVSFDAARRDAGGVAPIGLDAGTPSGGDECGDLRGASSAVYYGTPSPSHLPLRAGQVLAVASFNGCSGLLVAPRWVLSARHCMLRAGSTACFDRQARDPRICIDAVAAHHEPSGGDLTLLELEVDVSTRLAEIEPVPITYEDVDASWVGRTVEAGGYGQQEDGGFNEREFVTNEISDLEGDGIVVDGHGDRGVCRGDSGGPLMAVASDGSARSVGAVHGGDGTCTYVASFTRVDLYRDWIESRIGPTPGPGPEPCGDVTAEGRCEAGSALYCEGGGLARDTCSGACGWDPAASGYRCLDGSDPCEGITARGRCDGAIARWCDRGVIRMRDCGACRQACREDTPVGAYCE
ncbi:MAG: trypsin-like serine protease [Sandaracinaceae bacterium]